MIADLNYRLARYVHGRDTGDGSAPRADREALSWMRRTLEDVSATVLGIAHSTNRGPYTFDDSNTPLEGIPTTDTSLTGSLLPPGGRQTGNRLPPPTSTTTPENARARPQRNEKPTNGHNGDKLNGDALAIQLAALATPATRLPDGLTAPGRHARHGTVGEDHPVILATGHSYTKDTTTTRDDHALPDDD